MNILITGSTGFVGSSLVAYFREKTSHTLRLVVRKPIERTNEHIIQQDDISEHTDWREAVTGCDAVIHLAARVHVMKETISDPLPEYRRVNVEGTLQLARQAAEAGVKRFIFISSIKVNGEFTPVGKPFHANDIPEPQDPYGISKYEAELALQALGQKTNMEIVIIRPPLIYGPNVRGNFHTLIQWVEKGIPLPLAAINNQRSFVSIINLIDLIVLCLTHPNAAHQIFLVSDEHDFSTTELLLTLGSILSKPVRLFYLPYKALYFGACLLGKNAMVTRLYDSLQLDINKTKELLNWKPVINMEETLKQ